MPDGGKRGKENKGEEIEKLHDEKNKIYKRRKSEAENKKRRQVKWARRVFCSSYPTSS